MARVSLIKYSSAFVVMPDGFGTLDEVFEAVTLTQTGKLDPFPIIAMGGAFWDTMRAFIEDTMIAKCTNLPADLDHEPNDPRNAVALIGRCSRPG
jgi:hypothetical protein